MHIYQNRKSKSAPTNKRSAIRSLQTRLPQPLKPSLYLPHVRTHGANWGKYCHRSHELIGKIFGVVETLSWYFSNYSSTEGAFAALAICDILCLSGQSAVGLGAFCERKVFWNCISLSGCFWCCHVVIWLVHIQKCVFIFSCLWFFKSFVAMCFPFPVFFFFRCQMKRPHFVFVFFKTGLITRNTADIIRETWLVLHYWWKAQTTK